MTRKRRFTESKLPASSPITTGNISGTGIAIGHGASVTIINQIVRGPDELPTRYDGLIQSFLEYYLGTKDKPAPFGGRAHDLDALDAWLNDPSAPPYAALIAPAGRGKSALLAHWITRLMADEVHAPHIVYFPISIRFSTNLETVVYASLAARMAHVHGEKVTQAFDAQQYRGVFADYVRRAPPDGRPVLVVIDGLDEAAGWDIGAGLFPITPPSHLHVLIAARPMAGDVDERAWLSRLGWDAAGLAKPLSLGGLDRAGVADVLQQMGNPLDRLATTIDVVGKLHELSEGDPLLVRLYVEALLPHGEQAAAFTPDDLATLKPGLDTYFKRWFDEQYKLWGAAKPLQDKAVRGLLNLCATALGPLMKSDVLVLAPDYVEDGWLIEEAARAVNRFVIGDGANSGYVFSHSRLGEYFAGHLIPPQRQAWQARFLKYGKDTLNALEAKTLLPKDAPAYVVQYYHAHLANADALAADFYELMCEGWLRGWEQLEGTPAGFLNDVRWAWEQAEAAGSVGLGQQVRAALCFASVASLSANIPNELLVACLDADLITLPLALVMARQKPDMKERAECLARLAERASPDDFSTVMSEALAAARAIRDEYDRTDVLSALAKQLPEELLGEALAATRALDDGLHRSLVLHALVERLPAELLREALAVECSVPVEWDRAYPLRTLAEWLPHELLDEALAAARALQDKHRRVDVLSAVAQRLSGEERTRVLSEALEAARAIDGDGRVRALIELAEQLPEDQRTAVLGEALVALFETQRPVPTPTDQRYYAHILKELAVQLPEDLLGKALAAACGIKYEWSRASAVSRLAEWLPKSLLAEALEAVRSVDDKEARAHALANLARYSTGDQQTGVLSEALAAARSIEHEWSRASVLSRLAEQLKESLLDEALVAARAIKDKEPRAVALSALAKRLPEDQRTEVLDEALTTARGIEDEWRRAEAMNSLVEHLPAHSVQQTEVLREALTMARTIKDPRPRREVVSRLIRCLREYSVRQVDVLSEALEAACTIEEELDRVMILEEIQEQLPESLLGQALAAARGLRNEDYRSGALNNLAGRLPEDMLGEALTLAREIRDEKHRAHALSALAERLPEYLLDEALSATIAIGDADSRARVLSVLARRLPAGLLSKALAATRTIGDEIDRVFALSALMDQLPGDQQIGILGELLTTARTIGGKRSRALVLSILARCLPKDQQASVLSEALEVAREIGDAGNRASALIGVAEQLPEDKRAEVVGEALVAARAIGDEEERARALSKVSECLPEDQRREVVGEGLAAASRILTLARFDLFGLLAGQLPEDQRAEILPSELELASSLGLMELRAHAMDALTKSLPESLLSTALAMARSRMSKDMWRARVLIALSDRLPENQRIPVLNEALEAVSTENPFAPKDRGVYTALLIGLVDRLPEGQRLEMQSEALAAAREIRHEAEQVFYLTVLAGRLSEDQRIAVLTEAFEVARVIAHVDKRAEALRMLVEWLPANLLLEAFRLIVSLPDQADSVEALKIVATRWSEMCGASEPCEFVQLSGTLHAFAKVARSQLLGTIGALLPVIERLGGQQALQETAQAIIDTAKWWPLSS